MENYVKGETFLQHVQRHGAACQDPDCEVHNPELVEDSRARDLAFAYYMAGAQAATDLAGKVFSESETGMILAEVADQHRIGGS